MNNRSTIRRAQAGFTMIELMIVVAIIGILSAIGLPMYQDYAVKSQAGSALAEITPLKTSFEVALNEGKTPSLVAVDAGFLGQTAAGGTYCTMALVAANGGLECTTKGGNATKFNGKKIKWSRTADGVWSFTTTLDAKYRPGNCAAGA